MSTPSGGQVDFLRQAGLVSPASLEGIKVTLIGAGGIGSPSAMFLAKMGVPEILIIDNDNVTGHNLPNQLLFKPADVGRPKVVSLRESLSDYCPWTNVSVLCQRFDGQVPLKGIVVSGVDSMAARRTIWEAVKGNPDVRYYIEARMGAEFIRVYSFDPGNTQLATWYESFLYNDDEALQAPCTARAIIYTSAMVGALITRSVGRFVRHFSPDEEEVEILFDLTNLNLVVTYAGSILAHSSTLSTEIR